MKTAIKRTISIGCYDVTHNDSQLVANAYNAMRHGLQGLTLDDAMPFYVDSSECDDYQTVYEILAALLGA